METRTEVERVLTIFEAGRGSMNIGGSVLV